MLFDLRDPPCLEELGAFPIEEFASSVVGLDAQRIRVQDLFREASCLGNQPTLMANEAFRAWTTFETRPSNNHKQVEIHSRYRFLFQLCKRVSFQRRSVEWEQLILCGWREHPEECLTNETRTHKSKSQTDFSRRHRQDQVAQKSVRREKLSSNWSQTESSSNPAQFDLKNPMHFVVDCEIREVCQTRRFFKMVHCAMDR